MLCSAISCGFLASLGGDCLRFVARLFWVVVNTWCLLLFTLLVINSVAFRSSFSFVFGVRVDCCSWAVWFVCACCWCFGW